ncbi:MAG: RNA polymerase subunit sigma-70 [Bacteroidetes bacterium GWF2_41_61]|jgi:RNA polymerase sigma-70 factor (ECF subfamily)|nr:MAG: RNA polymerase subunit sigma-70 [Bacteroidetes bacterium GWE2_40_15]OFY29868.1 MAG: RNA polymerase subunit sigma-70 [Bacteroidetes bacterium GWF2_41_61]PKP05524.1 MAG: RNA polymerase subunit sigma-70 [Bacteroidetes bacterium HGW-Bacteroidetes-5]HBG24166.1 RNA polymerase subunit sigma-70 [Rikenellaceae bacterium]HBZ26203.1 RNA polymerase subunit sigma-70 [Rikenellaceae bacterium]
MQHPKDEYILSLIGDEKTKERGLSLLIDKYKERIYWHIRRLVVSHEDAQDVMQETFFNACRYIDRFESESRLYTWLYRIATNECIRVFRKNKLIFTSYDSVKEELINKLYYETSDESDKIVLKFQEAILHLPKKQRLVFNLRYYDEMSYEDISKVLNISTSSSKTNYHYASEKVKNYMLKL